MGSFIGTFSDEAQEERMALALDGQTVRSVGLSNVDKTDREHPIY